jgi:hypothetical protein
MVVATAAIFIEEVGISTRAYRGTKYSIFYVFELHLLQGLVVGKNCGLH